MKEAVGELNVTVIVVIAVGTLALFFFSVLWPIIDNNLDNNSRCSDAICDPNTAENGSVECYLAEDEDEKFICPFKG